MGLAAAYTVAGAIVELCITPGCQLILYHLADELYFALWFALKDDDVKKMLRSCACHHLRVLWLVALSGNGSYGDARELHRKLRVSSTPIAPAD